jgi:ADP-dependent NAD(P)H-hydrate dehydratase / NAD(P)H-hydrate epimerase
VKRIRVGLLIALGVVVSGVIGVLVGLKVYLPRYIEKRVVAEAAARGIELSPGEVGFGWQWVQLTGATAKLVGAPGFEAKLGLVDVQLQSFEPSQVQLTDVRVGVSGSLPRVLLELGEWAKNHPQAFEAPVVASRVRVQVSEEAASVPWLELDGGLLTRTVVGAAFSAQSCKLSGFELGKVGAGFAMTGGDVSIGFGDQSTQAAPLRLDASVDAKGAGKLRIVLTPTKLGLLGKGLGIPLPLPDVIVATEVDLVLPSNVLDGGEVTGQLKSSLKGFVPPHPPELDGFVFGDVTTFDTKLLVDGKRERVTLTESKVKAARFELNGDGSVVRQGLDAELRLRLGGALPCDALAGAAVESRLGQLLGRASGKQGKRTALAVVRGEVSVTVGIEASTKALESAKLTQKLGVGCGLRPLSIPELIALTPNAKDLQAIGDEVGKKVEQLGKDLGLPPVPTSLTIPLPPLPQLTRPDPAKQKELAAPASSR